MCGCNKNKGSVARALAPAVPAPRSRGVRDVVSRPVVQQREITKYIGVIVNRRDPRNPRRAVRTRERRAIKELLPLEIVDTKLWGPQLWLTLHALSLLSTTDAAKAAWLVLPAQLDGALPCPDCAQHYHDWYRANPLVTTEGNAIRDWVLALHNQVNERKQLPVWTAEQVVAAYSSLTLADVRAAIGAIAEKIGVGGLRALEELVGLCSTEEVSVTVVVEEESVPVVVVEEVSVPVEEESVPVVVVEESVPVVVVEESVPVVVVEESVPVVEESVPVVEESVPVVEESVPVVEESVPVVEEPTE